jgi:hypothetical protein
MAGKQQAKSNDSTAFYVYCVAENDAASDVMTQQLPPALEADTAIELVKGDGLSAITSKVPLDQYGEDALSNNLTEAGWLAPRAMRHEQVVEHFARRTSVVPLRFGTVYLDPHGIQKMLSMRRPELMAIIERLRGREEWGVNVYFDRNQLLESITSVSPKLRELAAQAESSAPGQSYLLKKKIESLKVDEVRSEITRLIDDTEKTLARSVDELQRLRVLKVESTEHGELKAKFAVLIERSKFEEFHSSVEQWAVANKETGMRLELTGPWPAYNFTTKNE